MVESGSCSYVRQVRNIEKAGGALALIIDKEADVENKILSDDGTGAGIKIPALLIGKEEGTKLKNYLQVASPEKQRQTSLMAEFLISTLPDNSVHASIWYTSSDKKSLAFIKNFADYVEPILSENLFFEPKFVTWSCPVCESSFKR
jgi:hypothetical protein